MRFATGTWLLLLVAVAVAAAGCMESPPGENTSGDPDAPTSNNESA